MAKKNDHILLAFLFILLMTMACKHTPSGPDGPFLTEAGPILFISDKSGTNQLYSMNEDGKDIHPLTNDPSFPILDAQWSPDGDKIAVVSLVGDSLTYPGFRRCIFIMNSDGSDRYQLTRQWKTIEDPVHGELKYGGADHPVWSPDSKQIAYTRLMVPESLTNLDVFRMKINGSKEERITKTFDLADRVTDWTRGDSLWGSTSGYSAKDSLDKAIQYTKLTLLNQKGNVLKSWGNPGESWEWPISSHSRDKIAFVYVDKHYHHDVYLMKPNVTELSNLTNSLCQQPQPISWSPDDSMILFTCYKMDKQGFSRIFLINSKERKPKEITPFREGYLQATSWRR